MVEVPEGKRYRPGDKPSQLILEARRFMSRVPYLQQGLETPQGKETILWSPDVDDWGSLLVNFPCLGCAWWTGLEREVLPKPESDPLLFEVRHLWFLPNGWFTPVPWKCRTESWLDDHADERSTVEVITRWPQFPEYWSEDKLPLTTKSLEPRGYSGLLPSLIVWHQLGELFKPLR